ncbi:MAG: hypothetical protein HUU37_07825 [Bdellovibrionales bacterium]|nr:hypothetical protein [Bdellovibrionales bacterium]
MQIDIPETCGEDFISRDAGQRIRNLIVANWDAPSIELLTKGKTIASVSFFDEAIGLLSKRGGKLWPEIIGKLKFPDLSPGDRMLLNSVVKARRDEEALGRRT